MDWYKWNEPQALLNLSKIQDFGEGRAAGWTLANYRISFTCCKAVNFQTESADRVNLSLASPCSELIVSARPLNFDLRIGWRLVIGGWWH